MRVDTSLPLGVGRVSWRWLVFAAAAIAVVAFGISQYSRQLTQGFVVTGLRDTGPGAGAPWGFYIAFDVYFVGVSFAGITIAALIRLLDLRGLRPVARMAELLTVVALILAGLTIVADLGQPLRGLVNLFRYARPQSPFFGTFSLVIAGYLFASAVFLYLDGRKDAAFMAQQPSRLRWFHRLWAAGYSDTPAERERHRRTSFWLSIAILPLLVTAHSTLGFVFGLQVGRPGWYSALQAPAFVVLAGVSGLGLLVVLAALVRRATGERGPLGIEAFSALGRFIMVLLFAYLYFIAVDLLTATYQGSEHERRVIDVVLTGDYAWIYWTSVGLLVASTAALVVQAITRRWSIPTLVVVGVAVNLAAVGKRLLIVVPSLTKGTLLPYDAGSYAPTIVEYAVIAGLLALGALLIAVFMKAFPIMPLVAVHPAPATEGTGAVDTTGDSQRETTEEVLADA